MATTSPPPTPPAAPPPPESRPGGAGEGPSRRLSRRNARAIALGALAAVVIVVAIVALSGGGSTTYHLELKEAGQLVKGDQVQVGGVPVGSVTDIQLTPDYKALVTIQVEHSLTPLHEGTVAEIRVPSLTGVANRFVALQPGPNNRPALPPGATLRGEETREVTDLDQLFNTLNPKTRRGLQQFVQGSAEQYGGAGRDLGLATEYFGPAIASSDHFFAELVRDQSTFTKFLVETAKALTVIGARKEDLTDLVGHADRTFQAVAAQQTALTRGLRALPVTLKAGNQAFTQVPSTLSALTNLLETAKPGVRPLTELFTKLRPLVTIGTPVVGNFANAFSRPGADNDLTDMLEALPGLAKALTTASPNGVRALRESVPITAFFGPYAPELQGLLRTFGQTTGYYDANGHYARLSPVAPSFALGENNNLTPTSAAQALQGLTTGQLRRCPGGATQPSADGSAPFSTLGCDPSETP